MTLHIDQSSFFDLKDAIAYEFFMDNLPKIMGDVFETPGVTDEEITATIESITLLAGMSYQIAEKFWLMRTANEKIDDQIESD